MIKFIVGFRIRHLLNAAIEVTHGQLDKRCYFILLRVPAVKIAPCFNIHTLHLFWIQCSFLPWGPVFFSHHFSRRGGPSLHNVSPQNQILCSRPFRLRSAVERIHPSTGDPTTRCTVRSNSHEWIRPGPRPNKNTEVDSTRAGTVTVVPLGVLAPMVGPLGVLAPMVAVLAPELVLLALRRAARRQSSGAEGEP